MTKDEYIALLEMTTKLSYEYLRTLTLEELQREYEKRQ